jgi:hypothetical protein
VTMNGIPFGSNHFPPTEFERAATYGHLCKNYYMTSSMTNFVTKTIPIADSFDSVSTNVGGSSTYQIAQEIYTMEFVEMLSMMEIFRFLPFPTNFISSFIHGNGNRYFRLRALGVLQLVFRALRVR